MNTINQVLNQEVEMAGIATDSFIQTLVISGIIAVVVLIVAVALETRRKSDTRGFFSRKPVFIPGIIFIICAMLVITIGPAPMAQFYGINERQAYINADSNTAAFRVHDGMIYSHSMNVKATVNLVNLESLVIDLEFFIDDASVNTASLTINGSSFLTQETATVNVPLEPGFYDISFEQTLYYNGIRSSNTVSISCILSQPLATGMMDEVVQWDVYRLILVVSFIAILLLGIYVDRGGIIEKKPEYYQQ